MSAEAQYRAALRWYPRAWRRANEDVMVGTLLDVAEAEGRTAPSAAELHDLRRSGLAARADRVLPGSIRDRAAAVSLGAGTALALALLTGQAWAAWVTGANAALVGRNAPELLPPDGVVWQVLVHPALWVLAALAALVGWTAVSRVLLVATLPAALIAPLASGVSFLLRPSLFTLVMMAALALLALVGRPPARWQLGATGIAGLLIASWLSFLGPFARTYFPRGGLIDFLTSPWPVVALLVATVVLVALRRRVAALSVLVASAPWLMLLAGDAVILSGLGGGFFAGLRVFAVAVPLLVIPIAILMVVRRYAAAHLGFGAWLSPSESSDSPTSASRRSSTR